MQVIKKDGTIVEFDKNKIISACSKSAKRSLETITPNDYDTICNVVLDKTNGKELVSVQELHSIVESTLLDMFQKTGECYRQYRNYKQDFVEMMNEVYEKEQEIRYVGDRSNANTDSTMVSTQRSLSYGILSSALYDKFFLNQDELQAIRDGYIYIHDKKDRRDTLNCCLFDIGNVLDGGFEMGNIWYNEPKTLDVAFDVISDIVMSASSQQYGGFTVAEVDKLLSKYAEKSYKMYIDEYYDIINGYETNQGVITLASAYAYKKVRRDFEQGFQSWEYIFNTVGSSRGDYPFIAISFGIGQSIFEQMATECILKTRMNGQGKKGHKKVVLFPKLTFLYDEELHGEDKDLSYLFDLAIECSKKAMYPDYLSLSGDGYIPSIYKKYGKVISLMGF